MRDACRWETIVNRNEADDLREALIERQRSALVSGELVEARIDIPEPDATSTDEQINERYDRGEVRIVTEQARYPLSSVSALLAGDEYKLDPDYQRRHRWSETQKSRLIESFIMNVPVPPIFLYEYDYSRYEVMDGLQRLTAVKEFYQNAFRLTNLEYWEELNGKTYQDLPSRIKDGVNRRYLSSIVLLKETSHGDDDPERLKRFVFGRINTGGVKLSHQELRNALYDGPMNSACKDLSRNSSLRRLWGIPENVEQLVELRASANEAVDESSDLPLDGVDDDTPIPAAYREMTDVELVLRFFANRQRMIVYRDNIRDYLDSYLKAANGFEPSVIGALETIFEETVSLAEAVLGQNAFRRPRSGEAWSSVPSVSIYDAVMNVLSRMRPFGDDLLARADDVQAGLRQFYAENSAVFNLRGQTRRDVIRREMLMEEYLRSFVARDVI